MANRINNLPRNQSARRIHHSAAHGMGFTIGNLHLYVGPGLIGQPGPILAYQRHDEDTPTHVATFKNATAAEDFIAQLNLGIDELNNLHQVQLAEARAENAPGRRVRKSSKGTPPEAPDAPSPSADGVREVLIKTKGRTASQIEADVRRVMGVQR